MVKNLPVVRETWVRSLGRQDPLEKGMATQSSILTWRIPWTKQPGGLQSVGFKELDTHTHQQYIRAPFSPHSCQHLLFLGFFFFFFFLVIAILTGVR